MLDILVWFIAIETLGMLAFPLAFLLFSRLPDRGYTFAKPLALILVSYALWMLRLTQFLPNSAVTILAILVVIASVISLGYYLRLIKIMWFDEPTERFENVGVSVMMTVVLSAIVAGIVFMVFISELGTGGWASFAAAGLPR